MVQSQGLPSQVISGSGQLRPEWKVDEQNENCKQWFPCPPLSINKEEADSPCHYAYNVETSLSDSMISQGQLEI